MTYTVLGILSDTNTVAQNGQQAWSHRADQYRAIQRERIPIDLDHDGRWIGQIRHLELRHGNLWAIGEIDHKPTRRVRVGADVVELDDPLYWSAEAWSDQGEDIVLRSVALTHSPARLGARPLNWFPGSLLERSSWVTDWEVERPLLTRAAEARCRPGRPIRVHTDERPVLHGDAWSNGDPLLPVPRLGTMRYSTPYHGILAVNGRPVG